MKKNKFTLGWFFISLLMAFAVTACDDEDDNVATVTFPEKQTIGGAASETKSLTFDAVADWTLTSSSTWCYFITEETPAAKAAEGVKEYSISGKAGKQTVTIGISDEGQDYDNTTVASITISMNGQEAVLAEVTRNATGRTLKLYKKGEGDAWVEIDKDEAIEAGYSNYITYKAVANFPFAATNRPESLDPALTRPGRFDRRVPVELPDLEGREAILKVHAKKVQLSDDVDFHTIARMASGASGAELANIVNEAALRAVRDNREVVTEADLEESIEVVIAGYQKKNAILSVQEKKVVSYHEIGHALVAAMQTHSAPVQKITIIPRTSGALGYTMQVEQGDKYLLTKKELENKIATFTGGRAAEEVVFGEVTTGASNDIEQATKIARSMITRYGMSDDFDMVAMETVTNQYLGGDASLACSADTQKEIDRQVVELVKREHEKAKKILLDNRQKLDDLANYLYEKETITGDEFMAILNGNDVQAEAKAETAIEAKEADDNEKTV